MRWRIYYTDLTFYGSTREHWISAPQSGVQVVSLEIPVPDVHRGEALPDKATGFVYGSRRDRQFFTGVDEYDPMGYGPKFGTLIPDADYWRIWELAYGER